MLGIMVVSLGVWLLKRFKFLLFQKVNMILLFIKEVAEEAIVLLVISIDQFFLGVESINKFEKISNEIN